MHDISGTLYQTFVQIDPQSSEISLLILESFCYFSIIVTLKLYNFYTVQDSVTFMSEVKSEYRNL